MEIVAVTVRSKTKCNESGRINKTENPNVMTIQRTAQFVCCAAHLFASQSLPGAQNTFTDADADGIKAFLRQSFANTNAGMVIALLDESGSRIFSAGKLDNGTSQEVNADTVFEIGSITKTFTSLLLLDLVQQGDMKLSDPVAQYLPKSVKVPAHGGKEISLLNLAAQDSGLPFNADNLSGNDWKELYDSYTVEKMYAFLSGYSLTNDTGARFQYSNIGMSLLGHVMELKTGTNFESLVVTRICQPLRMESTCVTLTPEQTARMATGHDENGKRAANFNLQVMAGAGALRSTANDLLKYLSANLGFAPCSLRPLMEQMQVIRHRNQPEFGTTALPWYDWGVWIPPQMEILGHGGGTGGCSTFIGFDKKQRRGVVVLSNQTALHASPIGYAILQRLPLSRESGTHFVREIVGIGTALASDQQTGMLRITQIIPKSPAAQAGLSAGIVIRRINGIEVEGKSLTECLAIMGGPIGTKVRLELVNPDRKETNIVELVRQKFLTLY
jgi:serine-type D-Ala-D-Ala carboxypeptidase/endopeptidase